MALPNDVRESMWWLIDAYGKTALGSSSPATARSNHQGDTTEGRELTASFARARTIINDNGRNFVLHGSKTSGQ